MNAQPAKAARFDSPATRVALRRPCPLVLPALAFMAGIVLSEFIGLGPVLIHSMTLILSIVALVVLGVVTAKRIEPVYLAHALIVVAALGFGYTRHQAELRLPPNHVSHVLGDEPVLTRLAGCVVTQPTMTPAEKRNPFLPTEPSARTRFVLDATELRTTDPPTPITGFVRVSVETEELEVGMGDVVVVTGKLYRPFGPRNPGETDWARWNRLQSIYASLSVEGPVHVRRVETDSQSRPRFFGFVRSYAQGLLFEPFAQDESDQPVRLLDAMVLGHRSAAGRQLNEAFLRTGTIHFLTVSGFHVGVLAGTVWYLLRRVFRRGPRTVALTTMVVIALYALVVEHNAPILRATTMIMLFCLAQLTRRPFCGLNWLALSALCILAYNPFELFRAGFQLSFMQVLAIFTIVTRAYTLLVRRRVEGEVPPDADTWAGLLARWLWHWTAGLICVCIIAWIVSLPLVLFHFGRFAPWGAFQSIIVSPLVVLTVVLGFLTLLTQIALPPLGAILALLLPGVTDLLLWAVEKLGQLPGTLVEVRSPPAVLVIATYALLIVCFLMWCRFQAGSAEQATQGAARGGNARGRSLKKTAGGLLTGLVAACLWLGWLFLPPTGKDAAYAVHVLSVGSGSAALVATPDRRALLCDVGTMHNFDAGETVVRAARALGIRRLEAVVISHANFDHYSGAPTVLKELPTARLRSNPYLEAYTADSPAVRRLLEMLPPASRPPATLRAGARFMLGGASIEVLWPPDDLDQSWRPNDRALVLRVEAHGHSVLLPGDIERAAIRALLERHESGGIDLGSDVLIAPHHGAVLPRDTAAFYEAVDPRVVVNSSGRQRPKLTQMLHDMFGDGVCLLSTQNSGAVTIRITPDGGIEVETPFASRPTRSGS